MQKPRGGGAHGPREAAAVKPEPIGLQDYIVQVRLKHAADLLKYSNESIANIAEYVNFPLQSYMGRMFQAYLHMSPGQYRQSNPGNYSSLI